MSQSLLAVRKNEDQYVCMCPCMTTEREAVLTGMEFVSYCNVNDIDADARMMEIDGESIYKMWIVDFLISNRDRQYQSFCKRAKCLGLKME